MMAFTRTWGSSKQSDYFYVTAALCQEDIRCLGNGEKGKLKPGYVEVKESKICSSTEGEKWHLYEEMDLPKPAVSVSSS